MSGAGHPAADAAAQRWATVWVGIGVLIVAVTAVFLVLISNSLSRINADLSSANRAVTDVGNNTRTLPDQIERVNTSLLAIDDALEDLPEDATSIAAELDRIAVHLRVVRSDLASTAPTLIGTAENLSTSADTLTPITANLGDTADLLDRILGATTAVRGSLLDIGGDAGTGTGLAGLRGNLALLNDMLGAVAGELGDIRAVNGAINADLTDVCRSAAVSLLHGPQPC